MDETNPTPQRSRNRHSVRAADVAKLAGVSSTTVSYVLNGVTNQVIRAETRRRVIEAAADLGYAPSAAARTLRHGHSNTVLLVLSNLRIGHSLAELIENLTAELNGLGLNLVVRRQAPKASITPIWRELMPLAVMSTAPLEEEDVEAMKRAGVLLIGAERDSLKTDLVRADQFKVGQLQAHYLFGRGHRRFAYAAPNNSRVQRLFELRLAGVEAELALHGLSAPMVDIVPLDTEGAAGVIAQWRKRDPALTAICAYNDESAFAVLTGMGLLGLSAPGDIAVMGVDNVSFAKFAAPPLTTIDNRWDVVAKIVAHQCGVFANIPTGGDVPPIHEAMLVVRESA